MDLISALPQEVIVSIFEELSFDDCSALSQTNKRLHQISCDPYVRAHYFLARHGPVQALYFALFKGKLMTERVLEILLSSGAHLSRYLVQCIIQHKFRTPVPFIRGSWVRSLSFASFVHLLKLAGEKFPDIEVGKNEDDGYLFERWLAGKKNPDLVHGRKVEWDKIKEIFECGFIPFAPKDPIMVTFPIALALEPRLLVLAVSNGFVMDAKYRDFIFRKLFEKLPSHNDNHKAEIVNNVRELIRLDPTMFLSRTVAAEICMECHRNTSAYAALKKLDADGDLRFRLCDLVTDLLMLFERTRSVIRSDTITNLHTLYRDFPHPLNQSIRRVMLYSIFIPPTPAGGIDLSSSTSKYPFVAQIKADLIAFDLLPITRSDFMSILTCPFAECPATVIGYAKEELFYDDDDVKALIEDVVTESLKIGCKGKLLKRLIELWPSLRSFIIGVVLRNAPTLEDLPSLGESTDYKALYCQPYTVDSLDLYGLFDIVPGGEECEDIDMEHALGSIKSEDGDGVMPGDTMFDSKRELGLISQDTLTSRIIADETGLRSTRRRTWYGRFQFSSYGEAQSRLPYPEDSLSVGRWVLKHFGRDHPVSSVFMTHAMINGATTFKDFIDEGVPLTLYHFKILAKLGRQPPLWLWHAIDKDNLPFFTGSERFDVNSRRPRSATLKRNVTVESRIEEHSIPHSEGSLRNIRKRPRRSAAANVSYVVPDSDDEAIMDDDSPVYFFEKRKERKGKHRLETQLEKWTHALAELLDEEEKKWRERRRAADRDGLRKPRQKFPKTAFHRSLALNIQNYLVNIESRRIQDGLPSIISGSHGEDEDSEGDEYIQARPRKKLKSSKNKDAKEF